MLGAKLISFARLVMQLASTKIEIIFPINSQHLLSDLSLIVGNRSVREEFVKSNKIFNLTVLMFAIPFFK